MEDTTDEIDILIKEKVKAKKIPDIKHPENRNKEKNPNSNVQKILFKS